MNLLIWPSLLLIGSFTCSFAHHESGELRNEEFTDIGKIFHEGEIKLHPNSSFVWKVMTYNVLAQTQLEAHPELYKENDIDNLKWENRWPLIHSKIKHEDPHILCLQEVDPIYTSSHFSKLFELGYSWVFKKNSGAHEDGVAVFYKSDLFEDEAHSQIELNQEVDPLTANQVGVVVRLRVKHAPHHAVVVATTHLVFNPRRSATRLAQAQVMLAEIDRLAYNRTSGTYYPVILTGDFNLQPNSGVYRFITEGHLKYEGLSRETLEPSQDNITLSRDLLPCRLGVTDMSQHVDVVEARVRGEDAATTRLYHGEYNINPQQENSNCSKDTRFSSGTISHGFNFKSAYPHKQEGNKLEASTTHFNKWITVDYIFYSTLKVKDASQQELTQKDMSQKEIPQKELAKDTSQKETPQKELAKDTSKKETSQKQPLELLSWERLPTQDELASHVQHLPDSSHGCCFLRFRPVCEMLIGYIIISFVILVT